MKISDTQALRDDVQSIREALKNGTMTTTVARALLHADKITLDSLKLEMEAARLGSAFSPIQFHESDRGRPNLKVA